MSSLEEALKGLATSATAPEGTPDGAAAPSASTTLLNLVDLLDTQQHTLGIIYLL